MALRFKTTDRDGGTAAAVLADGARVERQLSYARLGGWHYGFSCSCGWTGRSSPYAGKSNAEAARHAEASHAGEDE